MQVIAFNALSQGPQPSPYAFPTSFPIPLGEGLPNCMKTNTLQLSTGNNWQAGGLYANNQQDRYWRIIGNPDPNNGFAPMCGLMYQTNCGQIMAGTRTISIVNTGDVKNDLTPYSFRRDFWVDAPTGASITCTLDLTIVQDDKILDVDLNGTSLGISTGNLSACTAPVTWTQNVTVQGGLNSLTIHVRNLAFGQGHSPMHLDVLGNIFYPGGDIIFVDNRHFIPNTASVMAPYQCAPPNEYIVAPTYSGTCLNPGQLGTVTIANYNGSYSYVLNPGNITLVGSTFSGVGGNIYTVTVTDGLGCTLSRSVLLAKPAVTLNAMPNCIPTGGTTSIGANGIGANAPYTYSINGGPFATGNIFTSNGIGIYTVTVMDAFGCTATNTIQIVNEYAASVTTTTPCISGVQTSTITASNTSANPPVTYSFLPIGGVQGPPDQYLVNTPAVYTVTATDAFGCTATSTIQIHQNTIPIITIAPSNVVPHCSTTAVQLLATPNNAALYSYSWTGTPVVYNFAGNPAPVNSNINNTYEVTVTDALGCTLTASYNHWANPFCCTDAILTDPTNHFFSQNPIYANGTATGILQHFAFPPGNVITTNDDIYIEGDILIDQNITFLNCPNMHLLPTGRLVLQDGKTLTINNSHLFDICDSWRGIFATNNTQTINILPGSWFKGMTEGIIIQGTAGYSAALLTCNGAQFSHNRYSMQFFRTPNGYGGSVTNSSFYDNWLPAQQIALGAIHIINCRDLTIGAVNGSNTFHSMQSGIFVLNNPSGPPLMNIKLLNNTFENIKGGQQIDVVGDNIHFDNYGCAIFSTSNFSNKNILLTINNVASTITHFKDVDKAIITSKTNVVLQRANMQNAKAGFMNVNTQSCKYIAKNNKIENSYIAMSFTGPDLAGSVVADNTIEMPSVDLLWSNNTVFTAVGIQLHRFSNLYNAAFTINNNIVNLNVRKNQYGIHINKTGIDVKVLANEINLPLLASNSGVSNVNESRGIYVLQANKSTINDNIIRMGGQWGKGLHFRNSPNMNIFCNDIESAYGMWVEGNNTTANNNIGNNRMAGFTNSGFMLNCMRFSFIIPAIDGRFGHIGNLTQDMNNIFNGSIVNQMVCKFSTLGCAPYNIYTSLNNLTLLNANCGNIFGCYYFPVPITQQQYECTPPLNIANNAMVVDIPYSEQLVRNQIDFSNYPAGAQLEMQSLYEALSVEPSIRIQSAILDSFYLASNNGIRQSIYNVRHLLDTWHQDSTAMVDSALFMSNLQIMRSANNALSTGVLSEVNEKNMTAIYLDVLEKGTDSLSASQKNGILSLAAECPYASGRGVYMARFIQALYQPGITYNDKGICGAAYKNGGVYDDEEKDRKEVEAELGKLRLLDSKINVYPNPTNSLLNIDYYLAVGHEGNLILYDITGRRMLTSQLSAANNKVSINVQNLAKGIYLYKYMKDGKVSDSGTVIKE